MLPKLLLALLCWLFPKNTDLLWWQDNMVLTKPVGVVVYILVLYCLTVGFSRVMINPRELTDQFLKSGDSLQDLHAGKDTKRYLSRVITRISFLSATILGICLCIPLILQMQGEMEGSLVSLPTSIMMLTGIWCNLYREVQAVRDLDAYEPFI